LFPSVACAIMGLYAEAVEMMQRSVDLSGMGHPLACRAAGVMTYLYDSGKGAKDRALVRMFQCKVVTFFRNFVLFQLL
jgi:hypothetical protein